MKIDKEATSKSPAGWEIWTTGKVWQAMKCGASERCREGESWGPTRANPGTAIQDAIDRNKQAVKQLSALYGEGQPAWLEIVKTTYGHAVRFGQSVEELPLGRYLLVPEPPK